jgi:hypothetical protein
MAAFSEKWPALGFNVVFKTVKRARSCGANTENNWKSAPTGGETAAKHASKPEKELEEDFLGT